MNYISTRTKESEKQTASYVIKRGLAPDGGLYVPESLPVLDKSDIEKLVSMSYTERATYKRCRGGIQQGEIRRSRRAYL